MSGPSGAGGTGADTRGMATVYTPKGQPTADFNWANLIQPLIDDSAGGGGGTPASLAYNQALPFGDTLGKGWAHPPAGATAGDYLTTALGADQTGLSYANTSLFPQAQTDAGKLSTYGGWALGEGANLYGQAHDSFAAAPGILDLGMDPKNVQYGQQRGQALDESNVANSMAGLGSSPYRASVPAGSLRDFDTRWQDSPPN